jgi:aryl-alcohol dehydrogenase-like predicted oxidoreductase
LYQRQEQNQQPALILELQLFPIFQSGKPQYNDERQDSSLRDARMSELEDAIKRHPVLEGVQFGTGTWAWGDRLFWGYGRGYNDDDLRAAFDASIAAGIDLFDTAEVYGQGRSETLLGQFIQDSGQPVRIATKFMPFPWRLSRRSLMKALQASLKRLGREKVELYQVHMPFAPLKVETWVEAMGDAVQAGLIDAVGVSNYDREQTQRAYDTLIRLGLPLASNQVEYHLLNRKIEKNGLLKHCQDLGVTVIAYSPLGQGLLTGKFTVENPPKGTRSRYGSKLLVKIQPLLRLMRQIGADHAGKTAGQVALNWTMRKGTFTIPGAKNQFQMEENAGALGWELTLDEMAALDEASDRVHTE